jgi:hypothetical protein
MIILKKILIATMEISMVVHTCNPRTCEAKAGGLLVLRQPGICSETDSKKQKKERKEKRGEERRGNL